MRLFLLSLLILMSSCRNDDDNTPIPLPIPTPVEFTSTNYIYEGNLRMFYLDYRDEQLDEIIATNQAILEQDQSNQEALANIASAEAEKMANNDERGVLFDLCFPQCVEVVGITVPENPDPPEPEPCFCLIKYNQLTQIVLLANTQSFSMEIIGSNQQFVLANTANNGLNQLPFENSSNLQYQSFIFNTPNYVGQAQINISSDNLNYSIPVYFVANPN